jgi:hypothetical protein
LDAGYPHETFVGSRSNEPVVGTEGETKGEEVLMWISWVRRFKVEKRDTHFENDQAGKCLHCDVA